MEADPVQEEDHEHGQDIGERKVDREEVQCLEETKELAETNTKDTLRKHYNTQKEFHVYTIKRANALRTIAHSDIWNDQEIQEQNHHHHTEIIWHKKKEQDQNHPKNKHHATRIRQVTAHEEIGAGIDTMVHHMDKDNNHLIDKQRQRLQHHQHKRDQDQYQLIDIKAGHDRHQGLVLSLQVAVSSQKADQGHTRLEPEEENRTM